jgi:hypothetical protein
MVERDAAPARGARNPAPGRPRVTVRRHDDRPPSIAGRVRTKGAKAARQGRHSLSSRTRKLRSRGQKSRDGAPGGATHRKVRAHKANGRANRCSIPSALSEGADKKPRQAGQGRRPTRGRSRTRAIVLTSPHTCGERWDREAIRVRGRLRACHNKPLTRLAPNGASPPSPRKRGEGRIATVIRSFAAFQFPIAVFTAFLRCLVPKILAISARFPGRGEAPSKRPSSTLLCRRERFPACDFKSKLRAP